MNYIYMLCLHPSSSIIIHHNPSSSIIIHHSSSSIIYQPPWNPRSRRIRETKEDEQRATHDLHLAIAHLRSQPPFWTFQLIHWQSYERMRPIDIGGIIWYNRYNDDSNMFISLPCVHIISYHTVLSTQSVIETDRCRSTKSRALPRSDPPPLLEFLPPNVHNLISPNGMIVWVGNWAGFREKWKGTFGNGQTLEVEELLVFIFEDPVQMIPEDRSVLGCNSGTLSMDLSVQSIRYLVGTQFRECALASWWNLNTGIIPSGFPKNGRH